MFKGRLLNISGSFGKKKFSLNDRIEIYGSQVRFPNVLARRALMRAFPQEVAIRFGILEHTHPPWPAMVMRLSISDITTQKYLNHFICLETFPTHMSGAYHQTLLKILFQRAPFLISLVNFAQFWFLNKCTKLCRLY